MLVLTEGKLLVVGALVVLCGRDLNDHEPALHKEEEGAARPAQEVLHKARRQQLGSRSHERHGAEHEQEASGHVEDDDPPRQVCFEGVDCQEAPGDPGSLVGCAEQVASENKRKAPGDEAPDEEVPLHPFGDLNVGKELGEQVGEQCDLQKRQKQQQQEGGRGHERGSGEMREPSRRRRRDRRFVLFIPHPP